MVRVLLGTRIRAAVLPQHQENIMNRKFKRLLSALAVATAFGCASGPQAESTGEFIDDAAITTKVKAAIFNDPALKVNEISVETYKGEVQLRGFVSSQATIDRAVAAARSVKGVKTVHNDMRIR
jgi:hyperosmotically inducible protein